MARKMIIKVLMIGDKDNRRIKRGCKCGCGKSVKIGNRYIHGHHAKDRIGWHHTEEAKRKVSEARKGLPSPRKGVILSEETKLKISIANKGKKMSDEFRRKISENPYRQKKEYREKQSLSQKGKIIPEHQKIAVSSYMKRAWSNPNFRDKLTGENSWGWKGGLSFLPYAPEFTSFLKRQISSRDDNTCQNPKCEIASKRLTIHHIDHDKKNNTPLNLITLCGRCNSIANYNRDYWNKFYTELLMRKYGN